MIVRNAAGAPRDIVDCEAEQTRRRLVFATKIEFTSSFFTMQFGKLRS